MSDDEVDCRSVIEELFTFLDGELTSARRAQISTHMNGCVDCHEVVEFHAELKMTIAARCREDVPEGLRLRISSVLGLPEPPGIHRA